MSLPFTTGSCLSFQILGVALSYDSCTCVALLAAVGRFCPKLYGSRPIIGAFGLHAFRAIADYLCAA